jgi:hypothetical protein
LRSLLVVVVAQSRNHPWFLRRQLSRHGSRGQWTGTKLACHRTGMCPTATLFKRSRALCADFVCAAQVHGLCRSCARLRAPHPHSSTTLRPPRATYPPLITTTAPPPHATLVVRSIATHRRAHTNQPPLLKSSVSRLWEEGIPAEGIRPFKDLSPGDWSTAPPVGKPKAYAPAHKFANWVAVLRTHLGRFVTATQPKLAANLNKVEQYLRFASACRTEKRTGKKRKLNTQPLHNKLRTEYYNVCALDQTYKDASARDAAFTAFLAEK